MCMDAEILRNKQEWMSRLQRALIHRKNVLSSIKKQELIDAKKRREMNRDYEWRQKGHDVWVEQVALWEATGLVRIAQRR